MLRTDLSVVATGPSDKTGSVGVRPRAVVVASKIARSELNLRVERRKLTSSSTDSSDAAAVEMPPCSPIDSTDPDGITSDMEAIGRKERDEMGCGHRKNGLCTPQNLGFEPNKAVHTPTPQFLCTKPKSRQGGDSGGKRERSRRGSGQRVDGKARGEERGLW